MKKNRLIALTLSLALVCSTTGSTVFAAGADSAPSAETKQAAVETVRKEKDGAVKTDGAQERKETVYVIAAADGSAQKVIVSDEYKNVSAEAAEQESAALQNAQLVKDNCWQGTVDAETPVRMKITYTLDGKEITPEELAGKSGHVAIRFAYENTQYETVTIDEKQEKIYVPFAVLTGTMLDSEKFSNVEVKNGTVMSDGSHTVVAGLAFPGMQESLGMDREKYEVPEYVEITADVEGFELETSLSIITNSLFSDVDESSLSDDKLSGLPEKLGGLVGSMDSLTEGTNELYEGLCTLLEKSGDLSDGMDQLTGGLNELVSHNDELNSGAKQVFDALLSTASQQLAASGFNVTLTVDNYSQQLDAILRQLGATYSIASSTAQSKVTETVNAQRGKIESAVTSGVRAQVEQKVTAAVRESLIDAQVKKYGASSLDQLPEQAQQAITAGVDQAISSDPQVKAVIGQKSDEQMQSAAIQGTISQMTQQKVDELIEENINSDSVKSQIDDAVALADSGIDSILTLKQSLDSYKKFYDGLTSYTAGVRTARNGAATIQENMPALLDGVTQLRDGSKELADGVSSFSEDGLRDLLDSFDGNLDELSDRIEALKDVSRRYVCFSNPDSKLDGSVKFIVRTAEIEPQD